MILPFYFTEIVTTYNQKNKRERRGGKVTFENLAGQKPKMSTLIIYIQYSTNKLSRKNSPKWDLLKVIN